MVGLVEKKKNSHNAKIKSTEEKFVHSVTNTIRPSHSPNANGIMMYTIIFFKHNKIFTHILIQDSPIFFLTWPLHVNKIVISIACYKTFLVCPKQ